MGANNEFGISLNATLNTKNAESRLKEFQAQLNKSTTTAIKIPVDIDTGKLKSKLEKGKTELKNFFKEVNTYKTQMGDTFKDVKILDLKGNVVSEEIKQVTSSLKNLTTETEKFVDSSGKFNNWTTTVNNLGETLQTRTTQYTNSLGELIKETSTWAGTSIDSLKQVGETVKEIEKINPSITSKSIKKVQTELGATVTTIKEVNKEGQKLKTVITEEADAEGVVTKTTEKWNDASNTLISRHKEIIDDQTKMSASIKKVNSGLNNTTKSTNQAANATKSFGQSLSDAISRLAKYTVAMLPIQAIRKGISLAIETVKDFDAAITEMGKVTDYSGDSLRRYTEDLGKLGSEVARTRTEMTEATTGWLKAGYSEEDAAKLAKYSALLQNTADEELSAAEATSILVSQLKAYHMEADEAIKITDIINKVSAEQAVSSYDISQGLTVASAAMATFGNSIEETTALLTAGTTIFQGRATQVARGLNMIATRVAKNEDALKKYDVEIYNSEGALKSTYQILTELSPAWEKMSNAERVALGNTLAGTNQYKILSAVMSQMKPEIDGLSTAQKAYDQALNASGETMKQNAVYMQSIEARITALKAEWEDIVLGKGGLQDFAKALITVGTGFLKLINSIGGLKTVLIGLAGVLVTIKLDKIHKGFTNLHSIITHIIPNIKNYIRLIQDARQNGNTFSETLKKIGVSASASQVALGAFFAVVTMGVMIWSKYQQTQEEAKQSAEQAIQSYNDYNSKLSDTYDKIINETTSKEELIKINKELSDSYDEEASKLKDINDLRDEAIEKLYEEYILKNKETARETAGEASKGREFFNKIDKETNLNKRQELEVYGQLLDDINKKQNEELNIWEKLQRWNVSRVYKNLSEEIKHYDEVIKTNDESLKNSQKKIVEFQNELKGFNLDAFPDIKKELERLSAGGQVDLTLRPVIDSEELNKQGYDAGKGVATVFSHTFSNEAGNIAMNFTPIMVDPKTGEYLGVMEKNEFEKYCQDVVDGVREDDLNLQIGAEWTGDNAIEKASNVGERICEISGQVAASMIDTTDIMEDSAGVLVAKYNLEEEAIQELVETQGYEYDEAVRLLAAQAKQGDSIEALANSYGISADTLKEWSKELSISEDELIKNAQAMGTSIESYYKFAKATKEAKELLNVSKNLVTSIGNLSNALKEQAENGSLSVQTQLDLIDAGYAAALVYDEETGACKLDEKAVIALTEAKLEMQIANLQLERSKVVEQLERERLQAYSTAEGFLALAKAKNLANQSVLNYSGTTGGRNISDPSKSTSGYGGNFSYLNGAINESQKLINDLDSQIEALEGTLKNVQKNGTKAFDAIAKGSSKASKGAGSAKKATDDLNKSLEETKKKYDTVIKWISKQYDKEIDKIKKAEKEALKAEEAKIKAKEKEKDEALDAIESEIKALEKEKKVLKEQKEILDDRKKALNDEKDDILDNIQPQIDALKDLSDARKDYWNEQIDALKKANQELKDNLELQEKLDALEKARNTKVKIYKKGQGFVYDIDQTAVNAAQKALDEYLGQKAYEDELARLEKLRDAELKNYEDRIKALEDYKDKTEKIYEEKVKVIDKDIDALEKQMDELDKHKEAIEEHKDAVQEAYEIEIEELNNHKEATQEAYEAEIEMWENYKQQFEDMVNAYEEQQNKLLFQQLTGITDESNNWMTRLDNLAEFVRKYNELQAQLDTGNTSVSNDANMSSGSAPSGGYSGGGSGSTRTVTNYSKPSGATNYTPTYSSNNTSKYGSQPKFNSNTLNAARKRAGIKGYANGIGSVLDDEIAIVGENPNKEIVIGSKINNGELMNLDKGTGVVNANSSKTLAGMLNQVGQFGASGFGSGNGTLNNNINNDSLVVNGVTIQGSNIKDPETFVNGLLNLKAEALQRAYRHR